MILILTSQLLLTQHWLCSTVFDDLSSWQLFWDCFVQQNFLWWISDCFWIAYCWEFFTHCFWNSCFYCGSCWEWNFLLPGWDSPLAQQCQQLLIPCFWHQLPWECLSTAHSMTWFFCRNHVRERMKSEGAPSFIWCTQIQMYVANSHSCERWAAQSDFWFCV